MRTCPPTGDTPTTDGDRAAILERVDEILELTYRGASLGNFEDPLEEAVYILLSQQTREAVYQKVYRDLRLRWRTWRDVLDASSDELVTVLRPGGFATQRASNLKGLLNAVATSCNERGLRSLTLDWLRTLPSPEVEAYLNGLPGIGPKSARCIMHYAFNRDTLAVDTHVKRILDRLELVGGKTGKTQHSDYDRVVPPSMARRLHVNLIHHGRARCRARKPQCGQCPLISFCAQGRASQDKVVGTRPVAVELFAGCGGLGDGFTSAGFFVAVAVEKDRDAAQTYRVNHPGTAVVEADALHFTGEMIRRFSPASTDPAAIIAGPPCQGYSRAGKRLAEDERNYLYTAVVDRVRELKPRFVAIENVPGMSKVEGKSYVDAVLKDLDSSGYGARSYLLRACDYGVPQLRKRLIFLAQRNDSGEAPLAPEPSHCAGRYCQARCTQPGERCNRPPTVSVLQALEGLPPLLSGQEAEFIDRGADHPPLLNGSTMRHSRKVLDKISTITAGQGPISYRRLHDDLARTIVAGHRALPIHPTLDRTLSVREAARIQGFRDTHVFAGKRYNQPLQVANAVPPALAEALACSLVRISRRA